MNLSPKQRFKANTDLVAGFNDIVDSSKMQAAFDAAFLEFTLNLPVCNDMQTAAANGYRTEGARRFLNTLQGLNSDTPKQSRNDTGNLDHKV